MPSFIPEQATIRSGLAHSSTRQPLVQIGAGKSAARMAGFRKTRDGFARQAEVDEWRTRLWESRPKIRLDGLHVFTAVSNAIAQKDSSYMPQRVGVKSQLTE